MRLSDVGFLIFFLAVAFAAGGIGSYFTGPAIGNWFATLNRPPLSPPNWVFGPIWTVLYICMSVSVWLVWLKTGMSSAPVILWFVQLAFNLAWSILFFGMRNPGLAFADIALLWLSIAACMIAFRPVNAAAALLMALYLLWVSFASYLNFMIWQLNR